MTGRLSRLDIVRERFNAGVETSLVVRTTRRVEATLAHCAGGSRILQWFLAEPGPEVIVIDLRETYTVGPLLRVLDRVVDTGSRVGERTGLTAALSLATARVKFEPLRVTGFGLLVIALGGLVASLPSPGATGGWLVLLGVALLATRERRLAAELAETRVGRALKTAFEPPEPQERDE